VDPMLTEMLPNIPFPVPALFTLTGEFTGTVFGVAIGEERQDERR
jgi:hypothetical protein